LPAHQERTLIKRSEHTLACETPGHVIDGKIEARETASLMRPPQKRQKPGTKRTTRPARQIAKQALDFGALTI
jgi:hypothetical protein